MYSIIEMNYKNDLDNRSASKQLWKVSKWLVNHSMVIYIYIYMLGYLHGSNIYNFSSNRLNSVFLLSFISYRKHMYCIM